MKGRRSVRPPTKVPSETVPLINLENDEAIPLIDSSAELIEQDNSSEHGWHKGRQYGP